MKMRRLFYFACVAIIGTLVFTSCEKDEVIKEVPVPVEVQRVSFEGVKLNEDGYENNFPDGLMLGDIDFYNEYSETYASWEGFAVSNNTNRDSATFDNQYSVYASGGANGSEKFAVAYQGFSEPTSCQFLNEEEHNLKTLMINNSTYTYLTIKNGNDYAKKFEDGDWFKIIITAYNALGEETGQIEYYLADFRDGKSYICEKWTKVDLSSLGKVNKLEFTFETTDMVSYDDGITYYPNTPTYACIDDIVYYVD